MVRGTGDWVVGERGRVSSINISLLSESIKAGRSLMFYTYFCLPVALLKVRVQV